MVIQTTLTFMSNKAFINIGDYGNGSLWSVNFHGFRKTFPYLSQAIRCALCEGKTNFHFRAIRNLLRDALYTSYLLDDEMTDEEYEKFENIIWFKEVR